MTTKPIFTHVIKRDGSLEEFKQVRITEAIYRAAVDVGGRDRNLAEQVSEVVVRTLNFYTIKGDYPTIEEINDIIEKVLIERGHARTSKAFILRRAEQQSFGKGRRRKEIADEPIPYKKIWNILVWNLTQNCETIEKINQKMNSKEEFVNFMNKCNQAYSADVDAAAAKIIERKDRIKVVIIAGPSSSGKTTTTIKLGERLSEEGLSLRAINVDNYFWDLEMHPKDKFGDYDFETPQAIDLKLFNENIRGLLAGEEIQTPIYDFPSGKRLSETNPMKIEKNDVLLIDCLHGLFPDLTAGVPPRNKFLLYIETLAQLRDKTGYFVRWTDIRLLRRMIRDMQFRAYSPEQTLTHWHYVRRSEMRHIIPYIHSVDHIINGALAYELPIHKTLLGEYFPKWVEKYKDDSDRVDAFIRANRVGQLFEEVKAAPKEFIDAVDKKALMREYIGGSEYEY